MSGLILCKKRTDKPFVVLESGIHIYCMEELCYYLKNEIYSLDENFFDEKLFAFLEEVGEQELIRKLKMEVAQKQGYLQMIYDVISSGDYYSAKEKKEIGRELNEMLRRTPAQNCKVRADLLKKKGLFEKALEIYHRILEDEALLAKPELKKAVWNNIAVIQAEHFSYPEAAESFQKAGNQEAFIFAVLLAEQYGQNPEQIQKLKLELGTQYGVKEEQLSKYRELIKQAEKETTQASETAAFEKTISSEGKTDMDAYYNHMRTIVCGWKNEYREYRKKGNQ